MQQIKINLGILLPGVPDEQDAYVQHITEAMQQHRGITEAHVTGAGTEAQLCLHYDPDIISIARIEALAGEAGAAITTQSGHLLLEVKAFRDMNEASGVEHELRTLPGIISVSVSAAGLIRIAHDRQQVSRTQILAVLDKNRLTVLSAEDLREKSGHGHKDGHADHNHSHEGLTLAEDNDGHSHGGDEASGRKAYLPVITSLVLLLLGIAADRFIKPAFFTGWVRLAWYGAAYLPAGLPVALQGIRLLVKGDVFTEFVLMTIATAGAFFIGEYPEGVAVMVFYNIGELFQDAAVNRAKRSIKALLDIRPATASVKGVDGFTEVRPEDVLIGDLIQIKAGDRVPLDGALLSSGGTLNTAALTGESKPSEIGKGETVLAGMINLGKVIELEVTKGYNDSSLARILSLVQAATTRKARTEQFIRKFSRIYTPVVVLLAMTITLLPYFFAGDYIFRDWLYRALIFLVISCPCALVISIPLGYFGGIGAASRNGILFKGSSFLDLMTKVNVVVMDKTGTLTKGVFRVQAVKSFGMNEAEWLPAAAALEKASTHPVAQAVVQYAGDRAAGVAADRPEEISGQGIKASVGGKEILVGNARLMDKFGITLPEEVKTVTETIVLVAVDKKLAGYLIIADELKEDSAEAVESLHRRGIETIMLSGDKQAVVDRVAKQLGIDKAFGDLLPEDKVKQMEKLKAGKRKVVAFVGDGINDAPVLALSDVGIAMGGLGSDAAIETADVIIQTDQPSRISRAVQIGRSTSRIVWQNIIFAFVVKGIVLALGAGGLATMWEAVFADVGVALLAVLNAMRIQRMKFSR